jgi:hypothetical protein
MTKSMLQFKKTVPPDLDFKKALKKPIPVKCIQIHEPFEVQTIEGTMQGKPGDWLMVGVNGEMYPCADEIFKKTYDIITEE